MSKLLSAVLIMALVFTSGSMVFADTSSAEDQMKAENAAGPQAASEVSAAEIGQDLEKQAKVASAKSAATTKAVEGNFSLVTMTTGNEKLEDHITTIQFSGAEKYAQSVKLSARGVIYFAVAADSNNYSSGSIEVGLYKDSALLNRVESNSYVTAYVKGSETEKWIQVPAGNYYLGVKPVTGKSNQNYTAAVACAYINGGDRELTNKKQILVGQQTKQSNYFKFKAKYDGYLKVQTSETGDNVTLCNNKKKALSSKTNTRYAPTYGVKKGKTYYVRIDANNNYNNCYALKVTNTRIKEKSGKKKSKAVLIKKKRTKKGTIVAGEKRTDWYKFKVTKKKRVRVTVKGATNNKLKVVIYKGTRRVGSGTLGYYNKSLTLKSYGKLSKGTYYIKVYRGTKTSSGWYSLNWR